ncbi:unnamed protein product [Cuscuta europaea]|uniref:Uncharacterized protein n=1 Tax=Cuscuta europaea TaxID=41803 RepID=A0A9P1EP17_CUSEU|nr:unnamed protein product [Cuscuta europaea]
MALAPNKSRIQFKTGPNQQEQRCDTLQRQNIRPHQQPQAGETDDGWHTVKYRGRQHPPHPNKRTQTHQRSSFGKLWAAGNGNRYQRLRIEDEIDFESDILSNLNINQGIKEKVNGNGRELTISPSRLQEISEATIRNSTRTPKSTAADSQRRASIVPSTSGPGAEAEPIVDSQSVVETRSLATTWADIVRMETPLQFQTNVDLIQEKPIIFNDSNIGTGRDFMEIHQAMTDDLSKQTQNFHFFGE